jgi:type IV secretory pathway protease TraF
MSGKPRPWLVWNATASTPIGLYRVARTDTFAVGDLVIAIPPEPVASFLADRGFLPRGVPLIKRVLALSRQTVCRSGLVITIGGFAIGTAREHDRCGQPLPDWQGCRIIENDKVFLMNPDEPASLDGRYLARFPSPLSWVAQRHPWRLMNPERVNEAPTAVNEMPCYRYYTAHSRHERDGEKRSQAKTTAHVENRADER